MFRTTDALEQGCDRPSRPELANEIDRTDVDPKLERRRRNERSQLTTLQTIFGVEPEFGRKTSMMRRDRVRTKQFAQMMRDALGHSPRVHENQRRPMGLN